MSGSRRDARRSLVVGTFDRFDAATVTALLNLAKRGPLHVLVLGVGFPEVEAPLMTAAERVEILHHLRGVTEATAVLNPAHLRALLDHETRHADIWWMIEPASIGVADLVAKGHRSASSLVGALR